MAALAIGAATAIELRAESRPATPYAQHLADQLIHCDAGLRSVLLTGGPPGPEPRGDARREAAANAAAAAPAPWCPPVPAGQGAATPEAGASSHTLPLLDTTGAVVGRLSLTWAGPAASPAGRALALRDALARRILGPSNLADPFPFVPDAAVHTRAQALVDRLMREHPDTAVLALRAPAPGTADIVVLGSSFGRHGKRADTDDLKVLTAPQPITGLYAGGRRFGVDLALRGRNGQAWGTMNVGYAVRAGDDPAQMASRWLSRALALREAVEAQVGDSAMDLGLPPP